MVSLPTCVDNNKPVGVKTDRSMLGRDRLGEIITGIISPVPYSQMLYAITPYYCWGHLEDTATLLPNLISRTETTSTEPNSVLSVLGKIVAIGNGFITF